MENKAFNENIKLKLDFANMKLLLFKYIEHVHEREGHHFLSKGDFRDSPVEFTKEEIKLLQSYLLT